MAAIESGGPRSSRVPGVNQPGAGSASTPWDPNNPYGITPGTRPERPGFTSANLPGRPDQTALLEYWAAQMGIDKERAAWLLRTAQESYNRGRAIEDPLVQRMQRLTQGGPESRAETGLERQAIAQQRDAARRRILTSMPPGPERDMALAALEAQAGGQTSAATMGAVQNARDQLMGYAQGEKSRTPGQASGASGEMDASQRAYYGIDTEAALSAAQDANRFGLSLYGTDMEANQGDMDRLYRANSDRQSLEQRRLESDRDYEIRKQQLAQNKPKKTSWLGGLVRTLAPVAASFIPGVGPFVGAGLGYGLNKPKGPSAQYQPGIPGSSAPKRPMSGQDYLNTYGGIYGNTGG